MARRIIEYDASLKSRAAELRRNMTLSEIVLWKKLKKGQISGYDFDRQRPIGNFIVDFYCKDLRLAIEVDGITHLSEEAKEKDSLRQEILEDEKINFLRFDALIVLNHLEDVLKEIKNWINEYEKNYGICSYIQKKRRKTN